MPPIALNAAGVPRSGSQGWCYSNTQAQRTVKGVSPMRFVTIGRLFLFALVPIRLIAQTADLSGLISDPSGLTVPNAKVTIKGQATGVTRGVVSNQRRLVQHTRAPARLLRSHGGSHRIQIRPSKRNRPRSGPARHAGLHVDPSAAPSKRLRSRAARRCSTPPMHLSAP